MLSQRRFMAEERRVIEHSHWRIVIKPEEVQGAPGRSALDKATSLREAEPKPRFLSRILRERGADASWVKGAQGELVVGSLLEKLPRDRWKVFHDISVGRRGRNIDHLVIGKSGVFTINTKNRAGEVRVSPRTLSVNGYRSDYLPRATEEGRLVSHRLTSALGSSVVATPVIAILSDDIRVTSQPEDVYVVAAQELVPWLEARPEILSLAQAAAIRRVAGRRDTWE